MVDGDTAYAKSFCQVCPVVVECFDEAMANPQLLGVWGGTTARERQTKRTRRAS
jgi:WhiB family redox-sensing transcriptional regulator